MKCISCNNDIPDGSVTCPYCTAPQGLNNGIAPTAPVAPATPAAPVQTQVQAVQQPVAPAAQPVAPAAPQAPVAQPVATAAPQSPVTQPVAQVAPVAPQAVPAAPATPVAPVAQPTVAVPQQAVPAAPAVTTVPTSGPNSLNVVSQRDAIVQGIQNGTLVNGTASASEALGGKEHQNFVTEQKKKNKKKFIKLGIVAIVIIGIIVSGVMFYKQQYQTGYKRVDGFVEEMMSFTNTINNNTFQTGTGSYHLELSINENKKEYGATLDGKYQYDLADLVDLTINASSLRYGTELVGDKPLNVELYLKDSRLYLNLQNFYEKYIYTDFDYFTKSADSISQNNVVYTVLASQTVEAMKTALNSAGSVQKIETSPLNGKKANRVTVILTADKRKQVHDIFLDTLINNPTFMEQYTIFSGLTEKEINDKFEKSKKETKYYQDITYKLEIDTTIMKGEYIGFRFTETNKDENTTYDVMPTSDGYTIKGRKDGNQFCDLIYSKTMGVRSVAKDYTLALSGDYYKDGQAYKIDAKLEINDDISPKVEEVKVKESIKIDNIPASDFATIAANIGTFGKMGVFTKPYVDQIISTYQPNATTQCEEGQEYCSATPTPPCDDSSEECLQQLQQFFAEHPELAPQEPSAE